MGSIPYSLELNLEFRRDSAVRNLASALRDCRFDFLKEVGGPTGATECEGLKEATVDRKLGELVEIAAREFEEGVARETAENKELKGRLEVMLSKARDYRDMIDKAAGQANTKGTLEEYLHSRVALLPAPASGSRPDGLPWKGLPTALGRALRLRRADRGETQAVAAETVGVCAATFRSWERGWRPPATRNKPAVLAFLGESTGDRTEVAE